MNATATRNSTVTLTAVRELIAAQLETLEFDFEISAEEKSSIADEVCKRVPADESVIQTIAARFAGDESLANMLAQRVAAILPAPTAPTVTIKLHPAKKGAPVKTVEGASPTLAKLLKLAAARRNILMVGPAGCGKSTLAKRIADELGLSFGFISCSAGMSESHLLGRLLPTGKGGAMTYSQSEFVRCYENGGVFLIDEIDAADSNVMLVINAALANGHMAVPNRVDNPVAIRHPDFICIAAANTYGTGADRVYVGRNQLDESTLDRFRIGTVPVDYDATYEVAACPNDELRNILQTYRARVRENKIRRVVSTRFMIDAYVMLESGFSMSDIEEALFSGWSRDEIQKVRGA